MAPELFGFWDFLFGIGWAILLLSVGVFYRLKNDDKIHYRYFLPHLVFKIVFGFVFALTYAKILEGGGDTLAYWEGAVSLNKLFWENPSGYFDELLSTPSRTSITLNFNAQTGYPPGWIYYEPESFFICKIASLFTFVTFNSYIALTVIFSGVSALGCWKLYELVRKSLKNREFWIVLSTLFIPTLAFWCSGVSKDTIILSAIFLLIYHLFAFIDRERKANILTYIYVIFFSFILYHTRPFMLIAIGPPLFLAFGTGVLKKLSNNPVFLFVTRFAFMIITLLFVFFYLGNSQSLGELNPDKYLDEVAIIQQDFAQNKTYTGYRYDLNISDYSPTGMIKAAPLAIATAFFRPFIWEANSAFLFLSGLEGTILLVLVFGFLFKGGGLFQNIAYVRTQEVLVFAFLFVLVFGFFVGFSSGLFNVLVRFKAPMLPFLILLFSSYIREKELV